MNHAISHPIGIWQGAPLTIELPDDQVKKTVSFNEDGDLSLSLELAVGAQRAVAATVFSRVLLQDAKFDWRNFVLVAYVKMTDEMVRRHADARSSR